MKQRKQATGFLFYGCGLALYLLLFHQGNQAAAQSILISGQAIDTKSQRGIPSLKIINTRNIQRFFGDSSGTFLIQAAKSDTLFFTATGYTGIYLCYRDSPLQSIFTLHLALSRLSYDLPNVVVQSSRGFEEVNKDAQKLGYRKEDYMITSPASIISSPFTYLYQLLSKREQDKREYAQLSNESRKNALLREVMRYYIDLGILEISDSQIEAFMDYCLITESFLQNSTEYEFILYLKERERVFMRLFPQKN